ncbi:MAG: histidinol-phosphate transaminase [Chloroflexota bacterium]|nr:histidinol-phosphate transaminase [Chloroflexota bacterium]
MSFEDISNLVRRDILSMRPYEPITPPEVLAERAGISIDDVIKLDGNENPYGCSPRVGMALSKYPFYSIYPDPDQRDVRAALSQYAGVDPAYILAGAGSDELIDLILRLFLDPGDGVINCAPTFGMYPFCTDVCGGTVVDVPRDANFNIDVAGIKKSMDNRTKVIFIASPNNPTANLTPEVDIVALLDTGKIVVVDEAYYEFSGVTAAPLVAKYNNLIVLRSFSKWAGLAGLRLGYGVFAPFIVEQLMKIKQPYNINAAAQVALIESMADIDYLRGTVEKIIDERGRLFDRLSKLSFLRPHPTRSNFILCDVIDGDARELYEALRMKGIFLRYFNTPLLKNCIRVSVGKPEHTDAVIDALKAAHESR